MITIRPFDYTDADYATMVRISAANWPQVSDMTIDSARHDDETRDKTKFHNRFILAWNGAPAAYGYIGDRYWQTTPNTYYAGVQVDPAYTRRGIGTAFAHKLRHILRERQAAAVYISTREDKVRAIRFLQRYGFEQESRYPESRLDVTTFDLARFAGRRESVAAQGIEMAPLSRVMTTLPDWHVQLWNLTFMLAQDEPHPDSPARKPLEKWVKETVEDPRFLPDGYMVALDGDRIVGLSTLWQNIRHPDRLWNGWTGVHRDYRQRGIAMAVKLHAIAFAQANGATEIRTDNHEDNVMYQINLKLGFEPQPAGLGFVRCFDWMEGAAAAERSAVAQG